MAACKLQGNDGRLDGIRTDWANHRAEPIQAASRRRTPLKSNHLPMDDLKQPIATTWMNRHMLMVLSAILAMGAGFTGWTANHSDRSMRENLLDQARLVAQAVNLERVQALSGTEADRIAPDYLRLKEQFVSARNANMECRFLYLMGRRADGTVFFFVDSEPMGSADESPAGQVYEEISVEDLRAFEERVALTSGPVTDRWGTWISALVPLIDPDTGALVTVLGMDFAVSDWRRMQIRAALPPLLLTLIIIAIFAVGAALLTRRARVTGRSPYRQWYLEKTLSIAMVGLFLSVSAGWMVREKENHARLSAFRQLANDKAAAIAKTLHTLQHVELEALVRFFEASEYVSPAEFRNYTDFLLKNQAIQAWMWAIWVPASDRDRIETDLRAEGLTGLGIWQQDADGQNNPATERDVYYPIIRVAPLAGKREALGFDLGSEPVRRAALEAAMHSGLTTCTAPIALVRQTGGPIIIQVFRPVFTPVGSPHLQGFAMAILQTADILKGALPTEAVLLELALGDSQAAIEPLAVSWTDDNPPGHGLSMTCPIFAFGKTFLVTAHAGSAFIRLYPARAAWLVALAGSTLTALLVGLFGVGRRQREQLEDLVAARTRDLIDINQRVELALHGADLGTWDWNVPAGEVIFNENWARMLGYGFNETRQTVDAWEEMVAPDDRPAATLAMSLHLEGQSDFYENEHRLRHKKGPWIWVLVKGRVIERDAGGDPLRVCGTYLDITERKQAREEGEKLHGQLVQIQRMEAVGRLAGGVAHDLNNLLAPIIGLSELLLMKPDMDEKRRQTLDAILDAGLRARDLVGQLLAFSRKQALEFKPADINRIIAGFEKLLRRTIPEDIAMTLALSPHPCTVMADSGQIEQVIMNLTVNAADAMPDGGRLTIETATVELDASYAASHPSVKPGPYLMMAVSDTGIGMDATTREHIFEPFFSTKGELGTGLGLATVFGIVKQHGGNIWVYSEPGRGTTFKVYLPLADAVPVESDSGPPPVVDLNGTETILVVEDNPAVRELAGDILARQGYTVLSAQDGPEALALAASHHGPLHLLLTDVVMPGMNGRALYQEAVKRHPHLKVLYMSGYTENVIAHRGVLDAGIAYIQKPFTVQSIAAKVREVLESGSHIDLRKGFNRQ
jgi:PAS domain S-box-containing protein